MAAERGTPVSGLVAHELEQLVARNARYEEAMPRAIELMGDSESRGGTAHRVCCVPLGLHLPRLPPGESGRHPLKQSDAYPADAEDGSGWEKLMAQQPVTGGR